MELDSHDIPIVVLTKAQSKFMMRGKGKEHVEEGNSPTKVTWKRAPIETKEIQKMLQWIWMGSKKQRWVKKANLGGLFDVHWTVPQPNLLEDFLHIWEPLRMDTLERLFVVRPLI